MDCPDCSSRSIASFSRCPRPSLGTGTDTTVDDELCLLETYTYVRHLYDHKKVLAFDTVIQNLIQAGRLTIAWVTEEVHGRALDSFWEYDDQLFSIADCASFVIARDRKAREVFGFDKYFLTMGFMLRPDR